MFLDKSVRYCISKDFVLSGQLVSEMLQYQQVYCPAIRCTIYAAAACDISMEGLAIVFLHFCGMITTSIFKILSQTA